MKKKAVGAAIGTLALALAVAAAWGYGRVSDLNEDRRAQAAVIAAYEERLAERDAELAAMSDAAAGIEAANAKLLSDLDAALVQAVREADAAADAETALLESRNEVLGARLRARDCADAAGDIQPLLTLVQIAVKYSAEYPLETEEGAMDMFGSLDDEEFAEAMTLFESSPFASALSGAALLGGEGPDAEAVFEDEFEKAFLDLSLLPCVQEMG